MNDYSTYEFWTFPLTPCMCGHPLNTLHIAVFSAAADGGVVWVNRNSEDRLWEETSTGGSQPPCSHHFCYLWRVSGITAISTVVKWHNLSELTDSLSLSTWQSRAVSILVTTHTISKLSSWLHYVCEFDFRKWCKPCTVEHESTSLYRLHMPINII